MVASQVNVHAHLPDSSWLNVNGYLFESLRYYQNLKNQFNFLEIYIKSSRKPEFELKYLNYFSIFYK